MLARIPALLHQIRLDLQRAWLRSREEAALRRLGQAVAAAGSGEENEEPARLRLEIEAALVRIEALAQESRASLEADRADMTEVASWVKPVIVVRGLCVRLVLGHRRAAIRRGLGPCYVAVGRLAAAGAGSRHSLAREVSAVRGRLARVSAERERWVAPYGGTAFPAWCSRAAAEAASFGRAVGAELRSHLLPKVPTLVGLGVGWWIAHTYTDSHLSSALRSIGIGSGGTRVVSSSTLEAMRLGLPLLAAALCAYLGSRISTFYRGGRAEQA